MLTFAQFERELTSERTRDKLLERAQKGLWNGGIVPFGYKSENKRLVVHEEESKIIKVIFEKDSNEEVEKIRFDVEGQVSYANRVK